MILALLCAAWLGGIAASATYGDDAWPLVIALAAITAAYGVIRRDVRVAFFALALPIVLAAGIAREQQAHAATPADAIAVYNDGPEMRVRGVLRDDPEVRDTYQRFAVSVRQVQLRGEWIDASGGVLITAPLPARLQSGDLIEIEAALESPPVLDGFDYTDYLAQRGIGSVAAFPRIERIGHDNDGPLKSATLRVRRELSHGLELALPEPHASLAQGVLLGRRAALPRDVNDDLNATNTSHLVVVSGANVVYVSTMFTALFASIVGRRRAIALSIVAVLAYAMLVGPSAPVMRATIMGIVAVVARVSGRRSSGITPLLLAAAIMAGIDPPVIRQVSFQLSFAATAGILYLAHPVRQACVQAIGWLLRRDEVPRWTGAWITEPLSVTVAAVVATAPLLALNFGRMSLVALPANMLIVPLFPFILLSTLLAALGGLLPWGHVALGAPAYWLLEYWLTMSHWFAKLPGAVSVFDGFTTPWAIASYCALATICVLASTLVRLPSNVHLAQSRPVAWRAVSRFALIAVPAAAIVGSAGFIVLPQDSDRLQVTVLDVGQGDAILIESPSGRDVLIDGGPGGAVLRGLGDELAWHDRSLDLIVLTHPQADHAMGLLDVIERYDVARVLAGAPEDETAIAREFTAAVGDEGVAFEMARVGTVYDLGDGVRLEVMSPSADDEFEGNDASIVLRLVYDDVSFLLTGDVEATAEAALIESGVELRSTVLKVPHHGSATSSSEDFLDAVQPSIAVVSAGAGNRFGHPDEDVVARLDALGTVIFNTAIVGAVHFETDGVRLWIEADR